MQENGPSSIGNFFHPRYLKASSHTETPPPAQSPANKTQMADKEMSMCGGPRLTLKVQNVCSQGTQIPGRGQGAGLPVRGGGGFWLQR